MPLSIDPVTLLGILPAALILLFLAALVLVSMRRQRERQRQCQAYAKSHGFSYAAKARLPTELRDIPYFRDTVQMNFGRRIKNAMSRTKAGIETMIFDYWYVGAVSVCLPTSRTTRATVVCLRNARLGTWRVFHRDDLQYVEVQMLNGFLDESLKALRA
ncbi:MAG: hypothetical protein PHY45_09115 [Rhodocyclaceae bacterium]|nr:hypothetical protein [Rhodocyclaceae bacterium]